MAKRKPPKLASTNLEDLFSMTEPSVPQPARKPTEISRKSKDSSPAPTSSSSAASTRVGTSAVGSDTPEVPEDNGLALAEWLQQSDALQAQNDKLSQELTQALTNVQQLTETCESLRGTLADTQANQITEKEELQAQVEAAQQRYSDLELRFQSLQQQMSERERQYTDTVAVLNATLEQERIQREANQSTQPLQQLLSQRGLRTHAEFTSFVQALGESPHCWNFFKDAQLVKETAIPFMDTQVHLISSSIRDTSSISGVCVPVSLDKCEISGGTDLTAEIREVITEVLLRGWSRLLMLGVPRSFVTFVRNAMGDSTIEVQVDARESAWQYTDDMVGYPVIFILGSGREKIPASCPAHVVVSEAMQIGQAMSAFRECLQQLDEP